MAKPTYEELEQRVKALEQEAVERKWAEEALQKAEEEKANILATMSELVLYVDTNMKILWANRAAADSLGLTADALVGSYCYKEWFQRSEPCPFCPGKKIMETGQPQEGETYSPDGRVWHFRGYPVRDANGEIKAIVEVVEEITERKRAEEALQYQRNLLRSIFASTPDLLVLKDRDSVYQAVNPAFCRFVGNKVEEIIGKTDFDLFPHTEAVVYRRDDAKVMETGIPQIQDEEATGHEGKKWLQVAKTPVTDEKGKTVGVLCSVRDISDRKRAEEALKENEDYLKALLDSIQAGVMVVDSETHTIVDANSYALEMIATNKDKMLGSICHGFVCPAEKGKCPITDLKQTVDLAERILINSSGRQIPILKSVVPLMRNGHRYLIESFTDITALKQAEEEKEKLEAQFREAQKMEAIGTLAGGIAHDFNNLLTAIHGNASLMLYDIDSTHPYYELLQVITKQVRRGAKLTAQLLGYARKGRYEVKPTDLNQVVYETSDTFGRTNKSITIHLKLSENLFSIEADQSQIEQVLLNLYINAAGAMPGGGKLTLKTLNVMHTDMNDILYDPRPGNYVLLTVTDTGTGMTEETRERIFDPFFTTKEMGRGTGLGLASVYGIIKGHRGYIHVESEKGRGTTFSLYLPASDKKVEIVVKTAEHVVKGRGTVLLVDDEAPVLNIGVMMLEAIGYTVFEAKSGVEAVKIYEANKDIIDLVILDMIMPEMGGGETYDRMKEINPNVKVLLSSGYSIEGQATEILERGCDGFIQKPFNIKALSVNMRKILDKDAKKNL